jgi:hypothetical protein
MTGPRHRREPQRALHVLRREHVAGVRLLQLGHRADVAGAELVGVLGLLALRHQQLPDALLDVGAAVLHLRVVLQHALVDAEQVHAAAYGSASVLKTKATVSFDSSGSSSTPSRSIVPASPATAGPRRTRPAAG